MGNPLSRLLLLLAVLVTGAPSVARAGEVQDVRVEASATGTRAEIRLQGRGEFKAFSLAGPHRLVVDLPTASVARGLSLPAGGGIVTAVRRGQPVAGTVRIVFDLAAPIATLGPPRMQQTAEGGVLVIEWPGDGTAVAAATPTVAVAPVASGTPMATGSAVTAAGGLSPQAILEARSVPGPAVAQSPLAGSAPSPGASVPVTPSATMAAATDTTSSGTTATAAAISSTQGVPALAAPVAARVPDPAGLRPLIVAIDAGHGGQDPGAIGPTGKYEKNVTLAMAKELARQVDATPGLKSYLIRDRDMFIPLNQRAARARRAKADIFISLHADAAENRNARGSSVYVLSLKGASSQRARWLADKENASDLIGGVSLEKVDNTLSSVLLDLAQSGHMKASEDAAHHVLGGLKRVGNNHKPAIERANFAVLRTADMPAMLVETAFISNPEEEKRLIDPAYQRKVASAVLDGVQMYFTRQPPPGTLFAARAQAEQLAAASVVSAGGGVP